MHRTPESGSADSRAVLAAELERLREDYARELPGRLAEIERSWRELRQSGPGDDRMRVFFKRVHGLTGSGAIFGFSELSRAARSLENLLQPSLSGLSQHDELMWDEVEELLEKLRKAAVTPDK